MNLDNTYLPGHTHLGLAAGYRQFYVSSEKFSSFISLDYGLSFFKLYDPYNHFPHNTKNNIQELIFSLGSEFKFLPRFSTNLSFGYGIYRESFHTIKDPEATNKSFGMTITAKVGLKYQLFKR